ncbi:MAG: hypothetical protein OEY49_18155 [Candidatus Heimdallarchaeota archaeon]|nr:hypothetical protein [Candidatus Heimdallarchaeota archaeon]
MKSKSQIEVVFNKLNLQFNVKMIEIVDSLQLPDNFYGSPTILINGVEVLSCYNKQYDELLINHAISCRIYPCENGIGCPSEEMIKCALNPT